MNKEFYIKTAHGELEAMRRELSTYPIEPNEAESFHLGALSMILVFASRDDNLSFTEYAKIASEVSTIRRLIKEEVFTYEVHE